MNKEKEKEKSFSELIDLGFSLVRNDVDEVVFAKLDMNFVYRLVFIKSNRHFAYDRFKNDINSSEALGLNYVGNDLFNAITEVRKELGWEVESNDE